VLFCYKIEFLSLFRGGDIVTIKLSDYIDNPKNAFTDEEWLQIYKHAYSMCEEDVKLAEELMEVSNEALNIELKDNNKDVFCGREVNSILFMKDEEGE